MRASVPILLGATLVVARAAAGCDEASPECHAGDYLGCTCADGGAGYAACSSRGNYDTSACVCDGTTPGLDAGTPDGAGSTTGDAMLDGGSCTRDAGDAALRTLFESCTTAEDCESCTCVSFGSKGALCTTRCTSPAQCAAPAVTCTNRGVCRPPE